MINAASLNHFSFLLYLFIFFLLLSFKFSMFMVAFPILSTLFLISSLLILEIQRAIDYGSLFQYLFHCTFPHHTSITHNDDCFSCFFFFGLSRGLKLEPTPPCNMFSRLGNIARSGKRVNKLNQKILKNKKKIKIFPFRISKY